MHGRPFPLKGKNALYFNVFIHFVSPLNLVCVVCSVCFWPVSNGWSLILYPHSNQLAVL
jgi:hypothetical protein